MDPNTEIVTCVVILAALIVFICWIANEAEKENQRRKRESEYAWQEMQNGRREIGRVR